MPGNDISIWNSNILQRVKNLDRCNVCDQDTYTFCLPRIVSWDESHGTWHSTNSKQVLSFTYLKTWTRSTE